MLQNKWNEDEAKLTFKPEIPVESLQLLSKKYSTNISSLNFDGSLADSTLNGSLSERQAAHDRLHNTTISCQNQKLISEQKPPSKVVDPVEHNNFINRLTYEYLVKSQRQEELRKVFEQTDIKTGRPLFKPTLPDAPATHVLHLSEEGNIVETTVANSEKIYEKLLRNGEEHKRRMLKLQEDFLQKEAIENNAKSKHSLPESVRILQQSSGNSISEIFKVLLTCQMHNEAKLAPDASELTKKAQGLDPEVLLKISLELSNWKEGVLNIAAADPDLMIESVQSLLTEVIEISHNKNCNAKYPALYSKYEKPVLLDLELFSEHVWACIQKREGGGKSYLFLPRRDISPAKIEATPAFKPQIDPRSRKLAGPSRDPTIPVEDILLTMHENAMLRFEDTKREIDSERYAECTFQPHIYKLSNGIKPKPKYQNDRPPPPPPVVEAPKTIKESRVSEPRRGLIVSAARVKTAKPVVLSSPLAAQQFYDDYEGDSVGNDSITVPRHSIISNLSIESPPDLRSIPAESYQRKSGSSGGISLYSPPWIQK